MKIKVEADELNQAIGKLDKMLDKKSTSRILGCVKLSATKNAISLTANNLESALVYNIYSGNVEEPGEILIDSENFKLFSKCKNASINISSKANRVTVKCNSRTFEFAMLNTDDFPVFHQAYNKEAFTIKATQLKDMFKIKKMCSNDDISPVCQCICINGNNALACNRYRAVEYTLPIDNKAGDELLVSQKSIAELEKVIDAKCDTLLTVMYDEYDNKKYMIVKCDSWAYMCRLVEGEYIDLQRLFPKDYSTQITVDSGKLLESLEFSREVIRGEDKQHVHLISSDNTLTLESSTAKNFSSDKLDVDVYGSEIDIHFNPNYIIDGIKMVGGNYITLSFASIYMVLSNDQERHLIASVRV